MREERDFAAKMGLSPSAGASTPACIVLAGGQSTRIGTPKAWLPCGRERMLQRVVRLLGEAARPVVVASRRGQELPELPAWVEMVYDRREGLGPMEGLAAALESLHDRAEAAFVTGCDAPLLRPAFVRRMFELAEGFDIAVPHFGGFDQPLAAVYRVRLSTEFRTALTAGDRRIAVLFDRVATRRVAADELHDVDPHLESFVNINDPAAYRAVQERLAAADRR